MTQFIKHVGKHGDRRVAIIYRTIPGEEHMALVSYPDTLQKSFHDAIMKVIESDVGQDATELADALFRQYLPDGRPILQTLHKEGMIKKVPTSQIIVTPNATSHVRLDELNKIFDGIQEGDEAKKKMQEIDDNLGLIDPAEKRAIEANIPHLDSSGLDNGSLAKELVSQADKLAAEAKGLIAESKRLKLEAKELLRKTKPAKKKKAKTKYKKKVKKATS